MGKLNVKNLKAYMDAGKNIIVSGVHGVGKTAKLNEAASQLNLKMKYYSASTLDPYTDLTGVPVPNRETKTVEYFRPKDIDDAEIIFFDEVNRADPKTINAIFEITQFHTINGEPLPKLKSVVAAMNPVSDEYDTDELDQAFMDRFDVFLQADAEIDAGYFINKFGDDVGRAAIDTWNEYHQTHVRSLSAARGNVTPYLSPRRFDKIVETFMVIPARQTVVDCLPPEVTNAAVASNFYRALNNALVKQKTADDSSLSGQVKKITGKSIQVQRSKATAVEVEKLLANPKLAADDKAMLLSSLAIALNQSKGAATLADQFGAAIRAMSPTQMATLMDGWNASKEADLRRRLA